MGVIDFNTAIADLTAATAITPSADQVVVLQSGVAKRALANLLPGGGGSGATGFVSALDHGVVADGVTDNTSAILSALTTYGMVFFPPGSYYCASNIALPSGTTILGAGFKTKFLWSANTDMFLMADGCTIQNCQFTTPSGAAPGSSHHYIRTVGVANGAYIVGCWFQNAVYAAIDIISCDYVTVSNCFFFNNTRGALTESAGEYSTFIGCIFWANGTGLEMDSGNCMLTGCHFELNTTYGFVLAGGTNNGHCMASGCTFNHNNRDLHVVNETFGYNFTGCDFHNGYIEIFTSSGNVVFCGCRFDTVTFNIDASSPLVKITGSIFVSPPTSTISSFVSGSDHPFTYTPTSSSDANGQTGDEAFDGTNIYKKTASGWRKFAGSTFVFLLLWLSGFSQSTKKWAAHQDSCWMDSLARIYDRVITRPTAHDSGAHQNFANVIWAIHTYGGSGGGSGWGLTGNSGTNGAINFLGTTDNHPLKFFVNSSKAGLIDSSGGTNSTFFGLGSGNSNTGSSNAGFGLNALRSNTGGASNVSVGVNSLFTNTGGANNTAVGYQALTSSNSNGNTALGYNAGKLISSGISNTAIGNGTLANLTTGSNNIALGTNDTVGAATSNSIMIANNMNNTASNIVWLGTSSNQVVIGAAPSGQATNGNNLQIYGTGYFSGKVQFPATTTSAAPFNTGSGTAPTSPTNGDWWTTASHAYVQLGGTTYQLDQQSGPSFYQTVQSNGVNQTQRSKLNVKSGFTTTDNSGNNSTDVTLNSYVVAQDENSRTATNASAATQVSDTVTLPVAVDTFTVWRIKAYLSTSGGSNSSLADAVFFNFKAGTAAATVITGSAWNSTQVSSPGPDPIDITIEISYNTTDGWIMQAKGNCMTSSFGNNITPITIYSVLNPGAPSGSFNPTVTAPTIWWTYQQATGTSSKTATFKHMTVELLHK